MGRNKIWLVLSRFRKENGKERRGQAWSFEGGEEANKGCCSLVAGVTVGLMIEGVVEHQDRR